MNRRNEYSHCTGGHNCPARPTPLVDASCKALTVLSLTGADQALQNELAGAIAEPDRRIADLTAQRDELLAALLETWRVIDSAGLRNLFKGVQLGCAAWYVKASDAREMSMKALAKHQPTAAPAANTP